MTNISSGIEVVFANGGEGKFIAASTASPYFCVEGASEAELKKKVEEIIASYKEYNKTARYAAPPAARTTSITTLVPSRKETLAYV